MLIGGPPLPPRDPPPLGEREKGGEREGGPPRPRREEGAGERREEGVGEGPGLDWTEKGSVPLHGGGEGWGRGKKWEKAKAGPTWLSPGAVVPPSRAPSRGRTGFGRGAAACEPPRPRRPSPRPQRLTRRGRGFAPAPGGGAGIQSIPGERKGRGWGQEEPKNREPRSGPGTAEGGGSNGTGLDWGSTGSVGWLRGARRRYRRRILRDRVREEESTAIPRGPKPGSAGSAVQGQGSSRNPQGGGGI